MAVLIIVLAILLICFWLLNKFDYLGRVGDTAAYFGWQIVVIIILSVLFHN